MILAMVVNFFVDLREGAPSEVSGVCPQAEPVRNCIWQECCLLITADVVLPLGLAAPMSEPANLAGHPEAAEAAPIS
jgi:hypothetical protein